MAPERIGTVSNHADKESMSILGLWKECVSAIVFDDPAITSLLFYGDYSHYIVVHDPLDVEFPENKDEWNKRFCRDVGVSVVEYLDSEENVVHVKGLFAFNGSSVYEVLPYTSFDVYEAKFPEPRMEFLKKTVLDETLPQVEGKKILDIGCGVGSVTIDMAKRNPNSKVYGIEVLDSLTKQCQMNAKVLNAPNAEFMTGDIYDLPFEDGTIDAVTCFFMLHHLNDIPGAIQEVKRVLSKGGKVIAVDPKRHHHGPEVSESEWRKMFEDAGFSVNIRSIGKAVVAVSTRE